MSAVELQLGLEEVKVRKEETELDAPMDAPRATSWQPDKPSDVLLVVDDLLAVKADCVFVFQDSLLQDKVIPAGCQTLVYHLFDDDNFNKLDKKALEERINKDFKILKEILIQNPCIKKLVVREMALSDAYRAKYGIDKNNWHFYFKQRFSFDKFAIVWYNSLIELIKGTQVKIFELRDLGAQLHPNGNIGQKFDHYGPTDPIVFCEKLSEAGILSLDLANTSFASFLPSVVAWNRHTDMDMCIETCNPCTVLCFIPNILCVIGGICICRNPATCMFCHDPYGNKNLTQLEEENHQYFQRVLKILGKFPSLQVSFARMLRSMSEFRRERGHTAIVNLNYLPKIWKEIPFRRLIIDDFGAISKAGTQRASESDIVEAILMICQNDLLQELQFDFPYLFRLSETAVEKIARALAHSHIQKLIFAQGIELNFVRDDVPSTIAKCTSLVTLLKENKHFVECLILPSLIKPDVFLSPDQKNPELYQRYLGLLDDIQVMIVKNSVPFLVQKMAWGEEAEKSISEQLHLNKTIHDIFVKRTRLLGFPKPVADRGVIQDEVRAEADEFRGDEETLINDLEKRLRPEYITQLEKVLSDMLSPKDSKANTFPPSLTQTILYYAAVRSEPQARGPREHSSLQAMVVGEVVDVLESEKTITALLDIPSSPSAAREETVAIEIQDSDATPIPDDRESKVQIRKFT